MASGLPFGYPDIRVSGFGPDRDKRRSGMLRNPSATELKAAAQVFKALAHPDRLRLTCLLAERADATQHELVEELGWPQSTVARHLGTLRERGLVTGHRSGSEVLLEATAMPRYLLDAVCEWMHPAGEEA
jgi:DNA-binding transcriptional ArsR family regulator